MDIARLCRQQPSSLRLVGSRCLGCEAVHFPQRTRCPECGHRELTAHQFNGRGKVAAWTTVYEAPHGFAGQVPYLAGLIQLDEGPVIPAMIADIDEEQAQAGLPVEMVTRRIRCDSADGPILYGYKFAPVHWDE